MEIEIRNWAKYNPKRDQKTYTWFRLNNDIINSPEFFGLTKEEKLISIALLCEASKKNKPRYFLHVKWFCAQNEISEDFLHGLILKLVEREFVMIGAPQPETPNAELRPDVVVRGRGHDNSRPDPDVTNFITSPTYERTDVRTDGRTDLVFKTKGQKIKSTFIAQVPIQTDLSSDQISNELQTLRRSMGKRSRASPTQHLGSNLIELKTDFKAQESTEDFKCIGGSA